ncbi:unnamed protein product [Moneuplotes crassus]|uniref:Uncharacterized protein n=1 Tax=Euplotes crassus TaxID=5936 RepID=A0AAD1U341_EUPCR|nr:unnamed protein product [Moneuplotes crassus]
MKASLRSLTLSNSSLSHRTILCNIFFAKLGIVFTTKKRLNYPYQVLSDPIKHLFMPTYQTL